MTQDRVPPDVPVLLLLLQQHGVELVLVGSVAAGAWGADVGTPGDLDIVPAVDYNNLARLAKLLRTVDAKSWPVTGHWVRGEENEAKWEEFADGDPRRGMRLPDPNPSAMTSFDSLYSTRYGELDIVPSICGTHERLSATAVRLTVHGVDNVLVAHVDELLSVLTVPRRAKDVSRVAFLRDRQRQLRILSPLPPG